MFLRHFRRLALNIFLALLCGSIITSLSLFAIEVSAATNIEEINYTLEKFKSEQEVLQKKITAQEKKIAEKRQEARTLQSQINFLDNRIGKLELDIQSTKKQIEIINLEIEKLQLKIGETQEKIAREKRLAGEFVRLLQREGETNYVRIFILNPSFSSFFNKVSALKTINYELAQTLRALKALKDDLALQNEELTAQNTALKALEEGLIAEEEEIKGESLVKGDLLRQTKSSEAHYQALLRELRNEYQKIEDEITRFELQIRKALEAKDAFKDIEEVTITWPVAGRYITAYFHDPDYPFRNVFEHNAIDIRAAQGTQVRAAAPGYIARAKRCTTASCYSFVMVVHADGISTVYGHLSNIAVEEEEFITRGQVIGYTGGTPGTVGAGPFVTGPHLHFEVRINGIPVNPLDYLVNL